MKYFETTDLSLATVLVTLGFSLSFLDKQNPKKISFLFDRSERLDTIIQAYWAKQLQLEPQLLFANQKMLKNRIYSH